MAEDKNNNCDVLRVQGILEKGYGIIPKIPMQDLRLSIEAKAIYSYFRSFAGAGTTAFPSRGKILHDLQIGETRYYKHFNLLKQYGYIKVEQNTDNTGRFKKNIYTLLETIESYPQNEGTIQKPCPRLPYPQNSCTVNEGTKSNSFKNIMFKNQQSSQSQKEQKADVTETIDNDIPTQQTFSDKEKEPLNPSNGLTAPQKITQHKDDYSTYSAIIQENIDYDFLLQDRQHSKRDIDNIVECMLDVILTKGETVKISGEEKNREMVKSVYLKIDSTDIEHILDRFQEQRHKITHLHSYLKTMLYTVKQESNMYYTNAVRADGMV